MPKYTKFAPFTDLRMCTARAAAKATVALAICQYAMLSEIKHVSH